MHLLLLVAFLACVAAAGAALAVRLRALDPERDGDGPRPLEAIAAWSIATLFVWTSLDWVLAPLHAIGAPALLGVAFLAAAIGALTGRRALPGVLRDARAFASIPGMSLFAWLLVLVPLAAWVAFATWRGSFTPTLSHDALSYHLPRAIDIARTGTWRYLPVEDYRLAWYPASYEMLLADVIAITGNDQATSILGVLGYLAGALMAAAVGERRWGSGPLAWLTALVWAGTPLALLHGVGDKNDVLTCVEMTGVALWGARWAARGDRSALALATISAALAIGTKVTGLALVPAALIALGPFGLWARVRAAMRAPRGLSIWLALAIAAVALGGAAPYVAHALHRGREPLILQPEDPASYAINLAPHYGAWSSIPKFLALVLLEPFGSRNDAVWVPWRGQYWFWPRYELYFSSYGALVTVCVAAIPVALVLFARRRGERAEDPATEAYARTALLLALVVLVLPVDYRTEGFWSGSGRYLLFLPILAVEWGPALWIACARSPRLRAIASGAALVVAAGAFAYDAVQSAVHDAFAPMPYTSWILGKRAQRRSYDPAFPPPRAAMALDHGAGPTNRVLVDGGFGAWIRPAFGLDLTRPVQYVSPFESEREAQLEWADWVVVDHFWGVAWGSPAIKDMGDAPAYIGFGQPDPRELRFAERLRHDPRFDLGYDDEVRHQLVFWHKGHPSK